MDKPPRLTDWLALQRARARSSANTALFLQDAAADDIQERLTEVNRTFTAPAIITGFPDFWAARVPAAKIVADSETLDLAPEAHDLVVHALSLHWADDPIGQLVQCRHALKPDGLLVATLFGGQTLHELRAALAEAEVAVTGGLSPRVLPMGEVRDLGGALQRAGLNLPVADVMPLKVTYQTPFHLMHDLRAMGESNAMAQRRRQPTQRSVFARMAEVYGKSFGTPDGRIPATFEIITLTGWAPSENQPKPLKPGSATHRLADALGATQTPLNRSND